MRHNTGGEFPPKSGWRWLGIQFNNSDILVNVYAGKMIVKGKNKAIRLYGGRHKKMLPALKSVISTLQKNIREGKYRDHEVKWHLQDKLDAAKKQLIRYESKVTPKMEAQGLETLNIRRKKRKWQKRSTSRSNSRSNSRGKNWKHRVWRL